MNLSKEIPSKMVETVQCIKVEGPASPHDWFPVCFRETETEMRVALAKTNAQVPVVVSPDATSIITAAFTLALFIVVAHLAAFTMINNYKAIR